MIYSYITMRLNEFCTMSVNYDICVFQKEYIISFRRNIL